MSQYSSELGTLIDDVYGDLTSLLFRLLLHHGRLPLPTIQRYLRLPSRLVKHGLSALIQQRLVLWYTSDHGLTTYEASPEAAYSIVRSGKYLRIVEARVGKTAGDIIMYLLAFGHCSVGDYVQANRPSEGRNTSKSGASSDLTTQTSPVKPMPKIRGDGVEDVTFDSIYSSFHELLKLDLVSRVNASHFRSAADNRVEAEKAVPPIEHYKAKSKRENEAQWESSVAKTLMDWKYGVEDPKTEVNSTFAGQKRVRDEIGDSLPQKRQRLGLDVAQKSYNIAEGIHESRSERGSLLDDNTSLQINHEKFSVLMRNDSLINLAEESIGAGTSKVYAKLLHALEPKIRMCKNSDHVTKDNYEERDLTAFPHVSTEDLLLMFDDTTELTSALGYIEASMTDFEEVDHPKKRRKKAPSHEEAIADGDTSPDEDEDEEGSNSSSDDSGLVSDFDEINGDEDYQHGPLTIVAKDPRHETIRKHLLLLARHPYKFLHHFPQTYILPERWTVDFSSVVDNIVHHTLMETITSRYGTPARRIASILHEKGRIGEKDLMWISLLPQKPMKAYIAKMHAGGMVHLQEVPRDSTRTPARTMYLWFFDAERSKVNLMEEAYKVMARHLQRAQVEGEKVKNTVEKAMRSDVVGKEEVFLSVQEREALANWRSVERQIWGEIWRLDELVAIVRDY